MSEREKIIETMARALAPKAWKALNRGIDDTIGQEYRRVASSRHAETTFAALDAAGYVIVRRQPDEAMLEAGSTARCYREDGERDGLTDDNTIATWRAMLTTQEQKP